MLAALVRALRPPGAASTAPSLHNDAPLAGLPSLSIQSVV